MTDYERFLPDRDVRRSHHLPHVESTWTIGTVAGGWFGGSSGGLPTTAFATGITGNVGPGVSSAGSWGSARGWTANFGATAWQGTAPAGATGWTE